MRERKGKSRRRNEFLRAPTYISIFRWLNILKNEAKISPQKEQGTRQSVYQLACKNWERGEVFLFFNFLFLLFAYRDEYLFTTPSLFTLYAIANEGSYYDTVAHNCLWSKSLHTVFFKNAQLLCVCTCAKQIREKRKERKK